MFSFPERMLPIARGRHVYQAVHLEVWHKICGLCYSWKTLCQHHGESKPVALASTQGVQGNGRKLDTGPKITRWGKVKLEVNKPFPSSLFNISCKHPNRKSANAEVKRQVFLPFGKLFCLSSYEYINYISPESVCQCDVKRSTILQTAHFRNKIPFKLPALNCLGQRELQRKKKVWTPLDWGRKEPPDLSKLVLVFACLIKSPSACVPSNSSTSQEKCSFVTKGIRPKRRLSKSPHPLQLSCA